jgi:large subunit ribosomal protein L13
MRTFMAKKEGIQRNWYLVDAENKVLGRLASELAKIIRGKNKPTFTPHVDTGDYVIVINADKVTLTGNKWKDKLYYSHSGYPGGIKSITADDLKAKRPQDLIRFAVKGMLPKNRLGRKLFKKLKVYAGSEHPHQAQQPKPIEI